MASPKTFTQDQLENAQRQLAELPDLTRNKITQADALAKLKDQIVELAKTKGYSASEIKTALDAIGLSFSVKSITEILTVKKRTTSRRTEKTADAPK